MTTTAPTAAPAQGTEEIQDAGHVDVLIVGAGVSGIGAAYHLRDQFPERTFVILDAQDNRGGTWWTHRYPGVRSDSDLFTYGYRFKPWRGPSIAAGEAILAYLDEVIDEYDLGQYIRYRHRVTAASWSTEDRQWTVDVFPGQVVHCDVPVAFEAVEQAVVASIKLGIAVGDQAAATRSAPLFGSRRLRRCGVRGRIKAVLHP
jgi:glycine/D-amino acid oxidase-like deaminating enzyme